MFAMSQPVEYVGTSPAALHVLSAAAICAQAQASMGSPVVGTSHAVAPSAAVKDGYTANVGDADKTEQYKGYLKRRMFLLHATCVNGQGARRVKLPASWRRARWRARRGTV